MGHRKITVDSILGRYVEPHNWDAARKDLEELISPSKENEECEHEYKLVGVTDHFNGKFECQKEGCDHYHY